MEKKRDVLRETDAEAIRLAKTLIRSARYGALAVIDPQSGGPIATRVGVATDADGTPVILTSMLAAHTPAILADPRCSLLVGETGKGDPLAHPRITLTCKARRIEKDDAEHERVARRYLNRNPKAKLYAGLGDFSYFRLEIERASLNGGFGKAYALTRADFVLDGPAVEALATSEQSAIDHMNEDHLEAIALYARHFGGDKSSASWKMSGVDLDGMDLVDGDKCLRVFFREPLKDASEMRPALVAMARTAREAATEAS
ncbi:HugZ family protein [Arvimicrobium flavum]|uniref:HugZ family pyridoxamine 5'-phosphate oxidase n=1 Tax=Arvimicrobium flavum TaxID=3393320 RepID=UPI00237B3247|nr:HugZ family protein [Mesorhizobium shangrilense]